MHQLRFENLNMQTRKIVVIGSTNMDMVVKTTHIPDPGETVLAGSFFMNPGGKGANQAVAAARTGGDVFFVTKVGNDVFGKQAVQIFDEEGINTVYLLSDAEAPSGVALITVDDKGENSIVVAAGANANLLPDDLNEISKEIEENTIILMQLEIPINTVRQAIRISKAKKACVVLNPAPMTELSEDILKGVDILTPNQKEAEMLSGIPVKDVASGYEAAKRIRELGVDNVIVTMGAAGSVVCEEGEMYQVPAPKVNAVDTTAAGDVFSGALVTGLSKGKVLREAVIYASRAAAISVTRLGAQSSVPYQNEIFSEEIFSEKS